MGSLEKSPIFKDAIYLSSLNEERNITHKGKLMTDLRGNLNVFIDDDGILPVKDRLENRSLSYSCRHPILLNRDSYLTELIFFFFFF